MKIKHERMDEYTTKFFYTIDGKEKFTIARISMAGTHATSPLPLRAVPVVDNINGLKVRFSRRKCLVRDGACGAYRAKPQYIKALVIYNKVEDLPKKEGE